MGTLKFNQWQNPDGTENYKCRAWVNFNGTGTVAIRASGNVSSITDRNTGQYRINFTNAMPDTNYVVVSGTWDPSAPVTVYTIPRTTGYADLEYFTGSGFVDDANSRLAVFR